MDRDRRRLLQAWCALGLAASVPAFAAPRNGRSSARTRSTRLRSRGASASKLRRDISSTSGA